MNMIASETNPQSEIRSLEEELERLQTSTRTIVQQSWDEVEALQKKCADQLKICSTLESSLKEEKEQSEYWRLRFLDAEKKLQKYPSSHEIPGHSLLEEKSTSRLGSFRRTLVSMTSMPQVITSSSNTASYEDLTVESQVEEDYIEHDVHDPCSEEASLSETIEELQLKIESREKAIASLEQTVSQHVDAMQNMQSEMSCMTETHRIREKRIAESCSHKVNLLENTTRLLRKKCSQKDVSLKSQKKKILIYRSYVEELTQELGRLLRILQILESQGVLIGTFGLVEEPGSIHSRIQDAVVNESPMGVEYVEHDGGDSFNEDSIR